MHNTSKISKFLAAVYLACATTSAFALPVKENKIQSIDYSTAVIEGHTFTQVINVSFVTIEDFSAVALVKPIKLTAKCGTDLIGEFSLFYDESMSNKRQNLTIKVDNFEEKCKDRKPSLLLEPNGVLLSFDGNIFESTLIDEGESTEQLLARVSRERAIKKKQLIEAHSLMSNVAGSKESLYCLIKQNESDILLEGLVSSLTAQFEKIYGDVNNAQIACPAVGVLAKEVSVCANNPASMTLFCVVYGKYLDSKKWFTDSIDKLDQKKELLDEDINTLVNALKADMAISEIQTNAG